MPKNQIRTRQIADNAVTKEKIPAGAAIETTKLADGASFLRREGTVTPTSPMTAGNLAIINVATPSAGTDAANKAYVDGLINSLGSGITPKGTVRVATAANTALSGLLTIDGVTLLASDLVLVRAQTAPAENGVYVAASGAWVRWTGMDVWTEIPGSLLVVQEGTTLADTIWIATSNLGGTLGSSPIVFSNPFAAVGFGNSNFVDKEVPAGTVNGVNTSFTLAFTPLTGSEHLYVSGLLMEPGAGNDYTISGSTLTLADAPLTGENIRVSYRK